MDRLELMELLVATVEQGSLSAAGRKLGMVPTIVAFLEAYPEVDVRLLLGDRVTNLVEENIDAALRISILPDSTLLATKIGDIRRVVCGSPAYFSKHGLPMHPTELNRHPCITFEGQSNPTSWSFGTSKSPIVVPVHTRLTATTAEASIDAAKLGAGITRVLSYQVADAIQKGELVLALEEYEPPPIPVSSRLSRRRPNSAQASSLYGFCCAPTARASESI